MFGAEVVSPPCSPLKYWWVPFPVSWLLAYIDSANEVCGSNETLRYAEVSSLAIALLNYIM